VKASPTLDDLDERDEVVATGSIWKVRRSRPDNEGGDLRIRLIARTALLAVLLATFAVGSDKTAPAYQKGTIKGWDKRTDMGPFLDGNGEPLPRKKTVFELKGIDFVYLIDYCGAFQAGKFELGQVVDYRVGETNKDDMRLYIRRENGREYKCKIEGKKVSEDAKSGDPPAKH